MSIIRNIQFVSFRDLKIAYFLQGKALQEINCFRSLQETNLYVPSKTHDICCLSTRSLSVLVSVIKSLYVLRSWQLLAAE